MEWYCMHVRWGRGRETGVLNQISRRLYGGPGATGLMLQLFCCLLQVPFQDALDLVRTRKVYLQDGHAYIPHQEIITIVLNDFRTRLSKALAVSTQHLLGGRGGAVETG